MENDSETNVTGGDATPDRPLRADGKPYSDKHDPGWTTHRVEERNVHKEMERRDAETIKVTVSQYLGGLPEFADSSEARIDKVSQGLASSIVRSLKGRRRRTASGSSRFGTYGKRLFLPRLASCPQPVLSG